MTETIETVEPSQHSVAPTWWERSWALFDRWMPPLLLGASTALSLGNLEQPVAHRLGTLAVASLAAVWVVLGDTFAPRERSEQPRYALVYTVGLLVLATALMSRDDVFFVFAITAFFASARLRPVPLIFVGTAATSFLIQYITWGGIPADRDRLGAFVALLLVQTLLIGSGMVGSGKLHELNEGHRRMVHELQTTMAENEGLHAQLVTQAREAGTHEERQRLAREIHDTLAQSLAGVITQLEAARRDDTVEIARTGHLDNAVDLARKGLTEARRTVRAIGPEQLDEVPLPAAIKDEVARWARLHQVGAETVETGVCQPLHPEIEASLLRVVQEALANVAKHAGASQVGVTLSYLDDRVAVDVRDDGVGFVVGGVERNGSHRGFGLTAMDQRVARLAGALVVESTPGEGTAISATVPAVRMEQT